MPYVVLFASNGDKTQTAFLDRAVNRLVSGGVTEIRHVRRSGVITLTGDGTVLLTEATPKSARRWVAEADAAGVTLHVDARIEPPAKPSKRRSIKLIPARRTRPAKTVSEPPPARTYRPPGEPFKRDTAGLTVLVPGRGRVAVTDLSDH